MITPSNTVTRDLAGNLRQGSDSMLQTATHAIDATHNYASQAMDKAENAAHQFRSEAEPKLDLLAAKAQKLARQSMDMATDAKDKAQEALSRYSAVTTRYVSEQPMRSVLIAAAVGASVALLVSLARGRERH